MESKRAKFFECTCKYDKTLETGQTKKVSETNVVEASSFTEAETRYSNEMANYINGEFEVTAIKIAKYGEVVLSENEKDDKWFRVKVAFITIDEKTAVEKRHNVTYLVNAETLDVAVKNINEFFNSAMSEYSSISVQETKIFDVFLY